MKTEYIIEIKNGKATSNGKVAEALCLPNSWKVSDYDLGFKVSSSDNCYEQGEANTFPDAEAIAFTDEDAQAMISAMELDPSKNYVLYGSFDPEEFSEEELDTYDEGEIVRSYRVIGFEKANVEEL